LIEQSQANDLRREFFGEDGRDGEKRSEEWAEMSRSGGEVEIMRLGLALIRFDGLSLWAHRFRPVALTSSFNKM
jgi:hypothetical protein